MKKYVIINADDYNLTPGVSRGILSAIERGVVSSTSVFITEPSLHYLKVLKQNKFNGIGLHFNITYGTPVADSASLKTLVTREGTFVPFWQYMFKRIAAEDVHRELEAQLNKFYHIFAHLPTHIDTHHHVHQYGKIYAVLLKVAQRLQIPIRKRFPRKCESDRALLMPDFMHARFNPKNHWTAQSIERILLKIQPGIHEIIVHPGFVDEQLLAVSSFTHEREKELAALCSDEIQDSIRNNSICLVNYTYLKQAETTQDSQL